MNKKNQNLRNIGTAISCLSGLLLILDVKPEGWESEMSILTAIIAITGLVIIFKAIRKPKT